MEPWDITQAAVVARVLQEVAVALVAVAKVLQVPLLVLPVKQRLAVVAEVPVVAAQVMPGALVDPGLL